MRRAKAWVRLAVALACLWPARAPASRVPASAMIAASAAAEAAADSLFRGGAYPAARGRYERLLTELDRARSPDSLARATILQKLGDTDARLARYAESLALQEQALAIRERLLGPDDERVAISLNNLAAVLEETGHHARARGLLERALAIERRTLGPEHAYTLTTMHNLAIVLEQLGDYRTAGPLAERAAMAWARTLLPELENPAGALALMAALRRGDGEQVLVERARTLWEMARGPGRPQVLPQLTHGGAVTQAGGSYLWWSQLVQRLRPFGEAVAGPDHPDLVYVLCMLSTMQSAAGDFTQARQALDRAMAISERSFGHDHPQVKLVIIAQALLSNETGDTPRGRRLVEQSMQIDERVLGPGSGETGWALNFLALVTEDEGDEAGAEVLYRRAIDVTTRTLSPNHLENAYALGNLGHLEKRRGDLGAARRMLESSRRIMESTPFPEHPRVINVLLNLAGIDRTEGRLDSSRVLLERAMDITLQMNGEQHPDLAWELLGLAQLRVKAGDLDSAFAMALKAETIAREHQRLTLRGLSDRQALRYSAMRPPALDFAMEVGAESATAGSGRVRLLWDALIRSRALVLDEMAARHRAAATSSDIAVAAAAGRVAAARERLANQVMRNLRPGPQTKSNLDAAWSGLDRVEAELADLSRSFRSERALQQAGFAEVTAALDSGSALVAYARYASARAGYLAFVVHAGTAAAPVLVCLGSASGIDSLVERWGSSVTGAQREPAWHQERAEAACRAAGERLRRAIWDPLRPYLGSARRVFIVPDAELQLVPFGALPDRKRYLVESTPVLHELSAERDLVAIRERVPTNRGMLAMGGPDFDAATPLASVVNPGEAGGSGTLFRSRSAECDELRERRFVPLPQAAEEARWIAALWNDTAHHGTPSTQEPTEPHERGSAAAVTGALASEEAFKRGAPGKRVLHVATHGFFLGDSCRSGSAEPTNPGVWLADDRPLLLSGLALAGANRRTQVGDDRDDGILTAEEVGSLDLSGVEWAVLSACESGLGSVRPGEGVFGMRRAFEVAGAHTLIMSLWPVSDEWARVWMSSVYDMRFQRRMGTADAVRAASLDVLRRRRQAGLSTHPYFWAGFVATGDWR